MPKRKKSPPPKFATSKGSWDRTTYVMLFNDQLNSPAYKALSAHAKEAYTIIRQEYKGPEYTPDNVVKCTYPTFRAKGMRQNTVSRALDMLEVYGFVEIDRGGLMHQPNKYHLIDKWKAIKSEEDLKKAEERFQDLLERKKKAREKRTTNE